ncbi:MAG TPA: 1-phosphofructokinase, partial [Geodermatophilus sp.]|nr:1-phosphofructokinase [Geodermatophilus sp.]
AELAGAPVPDRLRRAVATGSAAAALTGSAVPTPRQVDPSAVTVSPGPPGSPPSTPEPVPAASRDVH